MTALRLGAALVAVTAGCAPAPASGPEAPGAARPEAAVDTLRLGVGEAASRDGHTLTFVGVVEDSRCPEDVECVWAGKASVQVEANGETVVLTLPYPGLEDGETPTLRWAGATFEVLDLGPYPGSEADRQRAPVVLTLVPRR